MREKPAVCLGFMARLRHHPVHSVSGAFHATQVSAKITVKDHRKWSLHRSRVGLHLIFCPCCFVYGALSSGIFFKPPLSTRQNLHFLGLSFYFAFTSCRVTQQGTRALLVILPRLWVHFFSSICSSFACQCKLDAIVRYVDKGARCRPLQQQRSGDKDAPFSIHLATCVQGISLKKFLWSHEYLSERIE